MSLSLWFAFVCASSIMLAIPGPTILLVIARSIAHGKRSVIPLALGVLCGDFIAMSASLVGLGALMATSPALFQSFTWVGAIYLIYLGVTTWLKTTEHKGPEDKDHDPAPSKALFWHAFWVTALNPKSIAFFVAFFPQFTHPGIPLNAQLFVLGTTFLTLATLNATLYAFFASTLKNTLAHPAAQTWLARLGGFALVGAGLITAFLNHS